MEDWRNFTSEDLFWGMEWDHGSDLTLGSYKPGKPSDNASEVDMWWWEVSTGESHLCGLTMGGRSQLPVAKLEAASTLAFIKY